VSCACRSFSYEEFIAAQEKFQTRQSEQLAVLNEEVARAIEDVIVLVQVRGLKHQQHPHHVHTHLITTSIIRIAGTKVLNCVPHFSSALADVLTLCKRTSICRMRRVRTLTAPLTQGRWSCSGATIAA
jgi:hypothetical protein